MANQIVVSAGAKVRNLQDVIIGTSGVLSSLGFDVANGVPKLDVNGKILVSQLPNSVMEYKGTWNAATNTPTLVNGTGNQGDVYLCNVAGTVNFGAGAIAFVVGDQVIYSGSIWQRASGATGTVTSVAITETGDSLNITGSPITTSGTINIGFNGTNLQYVNGAGNLTTFPILTGYVTAVSGTAPVVSSGGTTPAISMAAATGSVDGYLLATDFAIFNAKQSALTFSSPLVNTSGTISIPAATTSVNGYLASADFTTFNNKQNAITLTTTGTSGASTLVGATLNIPNYGSALTGYVPYTGATQDVDLGAFKLNAQSLHIKGTGGNGHLGLKHQSASATASANEVSLFADSLGDLSWLNGNLYLSKFITSGNTAARSYTFPNANGTVVLTSDLTGYLTAVTASSPLSSSGGTTPNITIALATTSASGYLSSTDWNTFNNKQPALGYTAANDSLVVHLAGTETITGAKSFTGTATFSSTFTTTTNLTYSNSGFTLVLQPPTLSANKTITLPNTTGTLALISDITSAVTSVTATSPLSSSGGYTPNITIAQATTSTSGYLSSTDWNTFNGKMNAASLTSGKMPFATGTSSLGDTVLSYNGGYFGFNTAANASYRIDVSGSVNVTGNYYINGVAISSGSIGGSGTTNYLSKFTASTTLGNSVIYDNGSSILIGTTDDGGKLVSYSTAGGTQIKAAGVAPAITFSNTVLSPTVGAVVGAATSTNQFMTGTSAGDMIIACYFTGSIVFGTGSTTIERIRISSGGNLLLGIGTDAGYKLDVNGTSRFQTASNNTDLALGYFKNSGTNGTSYKSKITIDGSYYSMDIGTTSNPTSYFGGAVGAFISVPASTPFFIAQSTTAILAFSTTGAATFSSSVTAAATSTSAPSTGTGLYLGYGSSTSNYNGINFQGVSATDMYFGRAISSDDLVIRSSAGERVRFTSGGSVLIGSTSESAVLWVQTSSAGNMFGVRSTNATFGATVGFLGADRNTTNNSFYYIDCYNYGSSTYRFRVADSGAITSANLSGTGSRAVLADANGLLSAPVSDISVKQNIKPIGYGLNEISKMNPVWFDFIDGYKNYGEGRQNGNIAQEMEAIIPEAVFTTPSTGKMGINYDQLHAVYIKAIQELKLEIEQLKLKIK